MRLGPNVEERRDERDGHRARSADRARSTTQAEDDGKCQSHAPAPASIPADGRPPVPLVARARTSNPRGHREHRAAERPLLARCAPGSQPQKKKAQRASRQSTSYAARNAADGSEVRRHDVRFSGRRTWERWPCRTPRPRTTGGNQVRLPLAHARSPARRHRTRGACSGLAGAAEKRPARRPRNPPSRAKSRRLASRVAREMASPAKGAPSAMGICAETPKRRDSLRAGARAGTMSAAIREENGEDDRLDHAVQGRAKDVNHDGLGSAIATRSVARARAARAGAPRGENEDAAPMAIHERAEGTEREHDGDGGRGRTVQRSDGELGMRRAPFRKSRAGGARTRWTPHSGKKVRDPGEHERRAVRRPGLWGTRPTPERVFDRPARTPWRSGIRARMAALQPFDSSGLWPSATDS